MVNEEISVRRCRRGDGLLMTRVKIVIFKIIRQNLEV